MTDYEKGVVLNVNKPYGWSSTDVVRKIKSKLRAAGYPKIKIGHAGTLDPLATGVLLVCIGKATKMVNELQGQPKEYVFTVELGATTPSFDLEHPIDQTYPYEHITKEEVEVFVKQLVGTFDQLPPLYSAKKVNGKRAYNYVRDGKEVELKSVEVTIYEAEILKFELPHVELRVKCSKGAYVRSIARDLGVEFNSGGYLTSLVRTKNGGYNIEDGLEVETIEIEPK